MTCQPLSAFPRAGVDTHRLMVFDRHMDGTTLLETNTLIIGLCGGWEHTDQHRHYSVTEMELCAEDMDYTEWLAEGQEPLPEDWYRDLDWE